MLISIASLFIPVILVAICVGGVAVIMTKLFAKPSDGDSGSKVSPSSLTTGRLGLGVSIIAFIIAIYSIPTARYLPENIGTLIFMYSLLAFPGFVIWGGILSFVSYRSQRHRSGLAGMITSGLVVIWLVASFFLPVQLLG